MTKKDKTYRHIEILTNQIPKKPGDVCGDVVMEDRSPEATTLILADGMGSGVKASIAATMCAARVMELIRRGFSLRETFRRLAATMHAARTSSVPFAAFMVARVLNDGTFTILTYEMPAPVFVEKYWAYLPQQRFFPMANEVVGEIHGVIKPGNAVFLLSDGVTQAGMGRTLRSGWTSQGAAGFINRCLAERLSLARVPETMIEETISLSGGIGDDTSVVLLTCRTGSTVHVLSGPPADTRNDTPVVTSFMESDGVKIVCGSTTAEVVSRCTGKPVKARQMENSGFIPPEYAITGIDLVTEGAITLNQVYNIIDEDQDKLRGSSSVARFASYLKKADRIYFRLGKAANPGHDTLTFRQMGILPRTVIIPLIAEKLQKAGKLVVVETM